MCIRDRADPVLASYLIGSGGGALAKLEQQVGKPILVKGKEDRKANDFLVRPAAAETIHSQAVSPVKLGEVLEVTIAAVKDEQRKDGIAKVDGFVIIVEDGAAYLGQRRKVKIDDIYATYAKAILLSMV